MPQETDNEIYNTAETGDVRQETGDVRQETRDSRHETGDMRQEMPLNDTGD